MAITMMCKETDPGARDVSEHYKGACATNPNHKIFVRTTHEGLVLETRERNYHDDSDFYAIVWDPETESSRNIEYATTRGWCYPNSAVVDASEEIRAKFTAWKENKQRETSERERQEYERLTQEFLTAANLTEEQYKDLCSAYTLGSEALAAVRQLLKTFAGGRMRSKFRISLATQIWDWLKMAKESRKFDCPLSFKQLDCLMNGPVEDEINSFTRRSGEVQSLVALTRGF